MYLRSSSLQLFFPLMAASSFFIAKLPGLIHSLSLSPGRSPWLHFLWETFPGNVCLLLMCDVMLRIFSVSPTKSPRY